jgi:hypothetical protein
MLEKIWNDDGCFPKRFGDHLSFINSMLFGVDLT